jgi:hypothetical protein
LSNQKSHNKPVDKVPLMVYNILIGPSNSHSEPRIAGDAK